MLISTNDDNGLCFIETAELDGETNLKVRQALEETCKIGEDVGQLSNFDGRALRAMTDLSEPMAFCRRNRIRSAE